MRAVLQDEEAPSSRHLITVTVLLLFPGNAAGGGFSLLNQDRDSPGVTGRSITVYISLQGLGLF